MHWITVKPLRPVHAPASIGLALMLMAAGGGLAGGRVLAGEDAANPNQPGDPLIVEQAVELDSNQLTESSGLAFSRRNARRLWSHNDSGGRARLFAFDTAGHQTGQIELNVKAIDWEDMAAFSDSGVPRLLVADCGDNPPRRKFIKLYLFDEPDPDTTSRLTRVQSIQVRFPDGPSDCEAIAVDVSRRRIIMVTKTILSPAIVYVLPLPDRVTDSGSNKALNSQVTAKELKRLALPLVTGMDIDPASGDVWLTSYFWAFRFRADRVGASLSAVLDKPPEVQQLPRWKQIEAIAVDSESNAWVTSEGAPAKFGRLISAGD